MFRVTGRCGWCQERGPLRFLHVFRFTARDPNETVREGGFHVSVRVSGQADLGPQVEGGGMAQCSHCDRPILVVFNTKERYLDNILKRLNEPACLLGGEGLIKVTSTWPPQPEPEQDPHWPEPARQHFKDAQTMLMSGISAATVIGACRTVLDLLTKQLGQTDGNLLKRIDALKENGVITQPIADWAHGLRLDGNAAVHDGEGNEDDAREYIEFLRMLLNVTFTLPARINQKKQRQPT